MITVHYLNNSRAQRVLLILEELGLPYEIVRYERDAKTSLAPRELLAVHPLGKSPVIVDDGVTIAETGAILDYVVEKYGPQLEPKTAPERLRYRYWMHYAEGSLMPLLVMKLVMDRVEKGAPFFVKPIAKGIAGKVKQMMVDPQLPRHLDLMEAELDKSEWFAGDAYSAADIQMSFPVEAATVRAGLDARYPKLLAYLSRLHARPAYKRALERGGPYALLR